MNRFNQSVRAPGAIRVAQNSAADLPIEASGVFAFLLDATIDAISWHANQAMRPAVLTGKVSSGKRTWRGAKPQDRLASAL